MKGGQRMRKDTLRRYMVYRMKLLELYHLHLLHKALAEGDAPNNEMGQNGRDFAETVRTAALSWFVTLVDKSRDGLNVFDLWRSLFPKDRAKVDAVWAAIEPQWKYLRDFRNKVGFHAAEPLIFYRAQAHIFEHPQEIEKAVETFLKLADEFRKREEKELPDFVPEVEECLLDVEAALSISVDRSWFRRALILPHGN